MKGFVYAWRGIAAGARGRNFRVMLVVAVAVTALCAPLLRVGLRRASVALSAGLQGIHAVFATMSFFSVLYMGGPLNKASFDLLFLSRDKKEEAALAELAQSFSDYLELKTVLFTLVVVLAAVLSLLLLPKVVGRLQRMWQKRLGIGAGVAAFFTMAVLPWYFRGLRRLLFQRGQDRRPAFRLRLAILAFLFLEGCPLPVLCIRSRVREVQKGL